MMDDFCVKVHYIDEYKSKAEKKADIEKRYKAITDYQREEELETFRQEEVYDDEFKLLYERLDNDIKLWENGVRDEIKYCNRKPYYKGWKMFAEEIQTCVKSGNLYRVS